MDFSVPAWSNVETTTPWTRWLVAFVCWAWLSLIAVGSWQTDSALLRVSLYVFAFLVCASDDRFLKPLLVVTTLVAAAQACIGLFGSGFPTDGLVGYVGDSHQFGLMMMAGILGALSVSWRSLRVVLTLLIGTAASAVFFGLSPFYYAVGQVRFWTKAYGIYAVVVLGVAWVLVGSWGFVAVAASIGLGNLVFKIVMSGLLQPMWRRWKDEGSAPEPPPEAGLVPTESGLP